MNFKRLLVFALTIIAGNISAFAQTDPAKFVIMNSDSRPSSEHIFLHPQYAQLPITVDASAEMISDIEYSFARVAKTYERLYGDPFDESVVPRVDWLDLKNIIPVFIGDDFINLDPEFPIMSVEGPAIYKDGQYFLRSPTPIIRKSYFAAREQGVVSENTTVDAGLPELPISHAIVAFQHASKCRNWPVRSTIDGQNSIIAGLSGNRTSTMKFFSTLTNTKALQVTASIDKTVDYAYRTVAITADAIARTEKAGMPQKTIEAEIEKWIGGTSLKYPAFRSNWTEAGIAHAFADPFLLTLVSTVAPQQLYGLPTGEFNALAKFETTFACADGDAYRKDPYKYINAFQTAFEEEAKRVGNPNISLSRAFLYAQLHKVYLPQIAANQSQNQVENYSGTFLDREKWFERIFESTPGTPACANIDFSKERGYEISGELLPFTMHCFRIKSKDPNQIQNFTASITIEGEGESEEAYDDLHITDSSSGSIGVVSKSKRISLEGGEKYLKTWILDTAPRSVPVLQEPDGSKLLFLFNIADRLSETKSRRVRIELIQGGATNTITAIRRVQERGRNNPATEYVAPPVPNDLTTRVSFDLQSKEDYDDPKLKLTYTYAKGMEDTMSALAKVTSNASKPVTGLKYPILLEGGMTDVDIIERQNADLNDLASRLQRLQSEALNNRFPETVNVIIEAPAPEPGFTGTVEDVLISVNWSSPNGKPHSVESIGPLDMSASPDAQIYLNNGTLQIRRFDESAFIADYEGDLTHEPILPPMRARQPFLNRDAAGRASGTVVATGFEVALGGDREQVLSDATYKDATALIDQIRQLGVPVEENEVARNRSSRPGSESRSGAGTAPVSLQCDCSCETFWEAPVSRQCTSICRAEYMICRDQSQQVRGDRLTRHAEAIQYYWTAMGISTPETQEASRTAILAMSDKEFQSLLDGIEMIGGPKSK